MVMTVGARRAHNFTWSMTLYQPQTEKHSFHMIHYDVNGGNCFSVETVCSEPWDEATQMCIDQYNPGFYYSMWRPDCRELTFGRKIDDCPFRAGLDNTYWTLDDDNCCDLAWANIPDVEMNFVFDGMVPARSCPSCPCLGT